MTIDFAALRAPFTPEEICWRIGSTSADKTRGLALAYVDARAVMDRLDQVCGPAGWQRRYSHADSKTICEIGIRVDAEWIWKADGAGDTDFEAEKGALSDAFKRAAASWGIGRHLYSLEAPWVDIERSGRSYVIKQHEWARLAKMLSPQPEKPAMRSGDFLAQCKTKIGTFTTAGAVLDWLRSPELSKAVADHQLSVGEREQIKEWARHRREALADTPIDGAGIPRSLDRRSQRNGATSSQ